MLVTGGGDGAFKVWDLATRKPLATRKQRSAVTALAFAPGGKHLVTGHAGAGLLLWDTVDWQEQAWLTGHLGAVGSVAFAPGLIDSFTVSVPLSHNDPGAGSASLFVLVNDFAQTGIPEVTLSSGAATCWATTGVR